VSARRSEPEKEASGNWVAYFDGAQSREGLGTDVLLVSPMGQHHNFVIQLTFPREGCASNTSECEGLLAGLMIAARMGISRLSIHGDSQLTASQAEGVKLIPVMKAYVGKVRKLECHFNSLKLDHVPRG
jgi:ribonuclease HI